MSAADLEHFRRQLASCKGQITKLQTKANELGRKDPATIKESAITRMAADMAKQQKSHVDLCALLTDSNETDEDNADRFDDSCVDLSDLLDDLRHLRSLAAADARLKMLHHRVNGALPDQAKATYFKVYPLWEEALRDLENLLATAGTGATTSYYDAMAAHSHQMGVHTRMHETPPSATTTTPTPIRDALPKITPVVKTLSVPTFTGDPADFRSWLDRMDRYTARLADTSAEVLLSYYLDGMQHPKGKNIITCAMQACLSLDESLDRLRDEFDRPRLVLTRAVKAMSSLGVHDYVSSDIQRLIEETQKLSDRILKYGDNSVEQLLAVLTELAMSPALYKEWMTQPEARRGVPSYDTIRTYLRELAITTSNSESHPLATPFKSNPSTKPPPSIKPQSSYNYKPTASQGHSQPGGRAQAGHNKPFQKSPESGSKFLKNTCPACSGTCYKLGYCDTFKAMNLADRKHIVKSKNYCANCLHPAHLTKDCNSSFSCSTCGERHHTLLHADSNVATNVNACAGNTSTPVSCITNDAVCMTARVRITGRSDSVITRALLDSGSQINLITKEAVKHLGLEMTSSPMTLQGVGKSTFPATHSVKLDISTCHSRDATPMTIQAMVVESLDIVSPPRNFSKARGIDRTHSLQLADPAFYLPAPVDMILGIRVAENIRTGQRLTYTDSELVAVETSLGWVIHSNDGHGGSNTPSIPQHTVCAVNLPPDPLDSLVQFWKDEEPPTLDAPTLTFGEEAAMDHFQAHATTTDGRYQVALPRKQPTLVLGDSRRQAVKRLASNHQQLTKKGTAEKFQAAVQDYLDKGHAEEVPAEEIHNPAYYLPMHGVSKESSTTTKLRVVFDASARSSNGSSLNDLLWAGPNTYPLLPDIIMQFRAHRIGMSADISQMFREILLAPEDRDYHRFVTYDDSGSIHDIRMLRLTFGVTSSPFLATQTLLKIADDQEEAHPEAAFTIRHHFYVDDCITGCDTLEEATSLRESLNTALQAGQMTLRKWRTNSQELLHTIPEHLRESETDTLLVCSPREHHKALGIHWDVSQDTLYIATPVLADNVSATKRQVSSDIARTFDVLGLFTPTTLVMKVLLQDIWRLRINWDDALPPDIANTWQCWRSQLHLLATLPINRAYMDVTKTILSQQLHGFADASLKAYAAALYLRIQYTDNTTSTALLYAKSKVAPVKGSTVPRLELRAAALLANLLTSIGKVLDIPIERVYAWSDSTTVLHWIRATASKFKPFVANRILAISQLLEPSHWFYVPTQDNPADVASRGCQADLLINDMLWWQAPPWLLLDTSEWPSLCSQQLPAPQDLELRSRAVQILAVSAPDPTMIFLAQFSSYEKMLRVVATLNRLANNKVAVKQHLPPQLDTIPTLQELEAAERHLWRRQQAKFWPQELIDLQRTGHVAKSSPLYRLSPIFQDGLIKVGGRLAHSQLAYKCQHPPILSAKDWSTTLLLRAVHVLSLHSGPSTMLGLLNARAHVVGAKRAIRSLSRKCVCCQRTYAKTTNQRMADLPACRVTPSPPFHNVGVDYAGPLPVRILRTRKFTTTPGYVALFICMATKAIHLELVTDLSADAFLLTFKRFIARRGLPRHVWSDNGGNFVGCRNKLIELYRNLQSQSSDLARFCASRHIDWHFSPGKAPHFGGLWEAGVKSAKRHLQKIVGSHTLTMEELLTTLSEIEAVLNSRPLCAQTSQPEDGVAVLTPGHFLTGRPLLALPEQEVEYRDSPTHLTRWKLSSMITQQFWRRWSAEYLSTLQTRGKWTSPQPNFAKDDVVLVKDTDRFQRTWPLARVLDTHPGKDGLVRAVTLQTPTGVITRPIHGLVRLISEDEDDPITTEHAATSSPEGEDV